MRAHEEERKIDQKTIIEKEAQEARRKRNRKARMARQAQHVAEIGESLFVAFGFGPGHPTQRRQSHRHGQNVECKRPEPREGREQAAERRKDQIADPVEKYFKTLAADFIIAFEQVAYEHDGKRDHRAEADSLKRSQDQEPGKTRRKCHRRAEESEDDQPPAEQQAPAVEVGNDAEDRREKDRRRGENSHYQREHRIADPEWAAQRRQRRLNKIHPHHQRDARSVDDAERFLFCRRQITEAEEGGWGAGAHASETKRNVR